MKYNINFHIIRVLGRFMKSLEVPVFKHVKAHGLTGSQFMVLEMLYSKGPLTVNEIIDRSFSTDGNIGVVINNLIKQELVEKRVDIRDKRVRWVSLTDAGEELIGNYFPAHEAFINELFASVSRKDKEALIELLKRIGKQL